ncbi:peptidoglycan DD-metalloendopeptidase family protein [Winogradskyella pacifica]|uniref:peptidoglycan DD-metalloendopeptidase family protein n=1 Tax=Winogradskyella pacifica TaxID=664642 RepID=UPI0015C9377C|nr:M23 family metallopeptidase [Winogradskyella pacifica]
MKSKLITTFIVLILVSCKQVQHVSDAITKPSARTIFERDFKNNDSIFQRYELAYRNAKRNNLQLELPIVLHSKSDTSDFKVLAYSLNLQRGERFKIESHTDSLQLAFDVFMFENDSVISKKALHSNEPEANRLEFDVTRTGKYKIVILPNLTFSSNFGIKLFTEPTLAFPVSGKDNKAIQSFWGASRSSGSRSHQGIDIFAKRGTPVVAATNGFISNTGNRGLGGKQVWLRDGLFGQSLYYAHLDRIAVSEGNRVKTGDTLGFVGNTGNAKTTSPHLHFGIYTSGGAVDPLPFVKQTDPIEIAVVPMLLKGETRLRKNELRAGASVKSKKLQDLEANTQLEILGKTQRWFHVQVNDTLQGFMHESLIKEIE